MPFNALLPNRLAVIWLFWPPNIPLHAPRLDISLLAPPPITDPAAQAVFEPFLGLILFVPEPVW